MTPPEIDRRRKHKVEVVLDRIVVKARSPLAHRRQRRKRPRARQRRDARRVSPRTTSPSRNGKRSSTASTWPAANAAAASNRSRRIASRSTARSAGARVRRTRHANRRESRGAIARPQAHARRRRSRFGRTWRSLLAQAMLAALCAGTGMPLDVPFEQLTARQRRVILHGTGEQWFDVLPTNGEDGEEAAGRCSAFNSRGSIRRSKKRRVSRRSSACGWSIWSARSIARTCGGSRLRDDARRCASAIARSTTSAACRWAILQSEIERLEADAARAQDRRRIAARNHRPRAVPERCRPGISRRSRAARRRSPTAKRSGFAWPANSAAACAACCMCSTSRPSACIRATTRKLLAALHKLRDLGNTLLVVEHDREVIEHCDQDHRLRPRRGQFGGQIVADGTPDKLGKQAGSRHRTVSERAGRRLRCRRIAAWRKFEVQSSKFKVQSQSAKERSPTTATLNLEPETSNSAGPAIEVIGARHNNLREHRCQDSARHADGHHRAERQRQEFAD